MVTADQNSWEHHVGAMFALMGVPKSNDELRRDQNGTIHISWGPNKVGHPDKVCHGP